MKISAYLGIPPANIQVPVLVIVTHNIGFPYCATMSPLMKMTMRLARKMIQRVAALPFFCRILHEFCITAQRATRSHWPHRAKTKSGFLQRNKKKRAKYHSRHGISVC